MPNQISVVDIETAAGPLQVTARITVKGPFYGGSSGRPEDTMMTYKARSLAERIERAVLTAIQNGREDLGLPLAPAAVDRSPS